MPANTKDLDYVNEYAASHGGSVRDTEYKGQRAKYTFVCAKGHEFEGNFNNMVFRSEFCPRCFGRTARRKFAQDDVVAYAASFGGEFLGPTFTRIGSTYKFRCSAGHEFERRFRTMLGGETFCTTCT